MENGTESQCKHDWDFESENSEGTEADFRCHLCGATKTVKNPAELAAQA